jgi:hypothetical protein
MRWFSFFKSGLGCLGLLLVLAPWVGAQDAPMASYYRCTRDESIIQALALMAQSSARDSVTHLMENDTKVFFKDMREMGKVHKNDDALSLITDDDRHIILINIKHQNAPPQALAALIVHEALHGDRDNSVHEEFIAWTREASMWKEMREKYPEIKNLPNYKIPLVDRENAIEVLLTRNQLRQQIEGNIAYQGLPPHSPGF